MERVSFKGSQQLLLAVTAYCAGFPYTTTSM